ncbi:MAG TPA: type II secretion system minor pseudopilin GspK [Candidatus Saccharimonadia bacterium]|nr:type II secretion system minor pseudopilin GspK [Candidatus Saccharimonadia bacterium]
MTRSRHARGVALLSALLVVALATVLVAGILDDGNSGLARTRNLARSEQADALAAGLEEWALQVLLRDLANDGRRDFRDDSWAAGVPPTEVPGGRLVGRMTDLGGRYNLNNLVKDGARDPVQLERYARLLRALKLDPALAESTLDYLDPDGEREPNGAEDPHYLVQDPPRRAANRTMAHASELKLVRGVTRDVWAALAPHVVAVPAGTAINVNTATAPVLMAIVDGLSDGAARRIAEGAHYSDLAGFQSEIEQLGLAPFPPLGVDVASDYFIARADIALDGIPIGYSSVIERRDGRLRVIGRARGTL